MSATFLFCDAGYQWLVALNFFAYRPHEMTLEAPMAENSIRFRQLPSSYLKIEISKPKRKARQQLNAVFSGIGSF